MAETTDPTPLQAHPVPGKGVLGRSRTDTEGRGSSPGRPDTVAWRHQMRRLEQVHEAEMRIPDEVALHAAQELSVTVRSVRGRFGEHARAVAQAWTGSVDPALLSEAIARPDFLAVTRCLREHGVTAPSVVLERLLRAAPGPAAGRLRVREAVRRARPAAGGHAPSLAVAA